MSCIWKTTQSIKCPDNTTKKTFFLYIFVVFFFLLLSLSWLSLQQYAFDKSLNYNLSPNPGGKISVAYNQINIDLGELHRVFYRILCHLIFVVLEVGKAQIADMSHSSGPSFLQRPNGLAWGEQAAAKTQYLTG